MHFRLVRYFTLASLGMFILIAAAMAYFQYLQGDFFKEVQTRQGGFFKEVQESFAKQQDEAARRDLLLIHENGNVNLTRLFANALWERDFAPFVAKAQGIDVEPCRAIADMEENGKKVPPPEKKACFAEVGRKIQAFPEFKAIDAKVVDSMKKSTVFKVKVFDLRGITVYSSEHKQMGEDKSFNAGWKGAAFDGKPKSELTHRDKFSAFEGVVENRDLISSYLPVHAPGTDKIVGVFEVYSDVTPFLDQIKQTSGAIRQAAAKNQEQVDSMAEANQAQVDEYFRNGFLVIAGLLLTLFGALFAIVRRADRIIVAQAEEREHTQQQLAQSEKMASLGQMVAGVAHQLNTPLAFCHNNVTMSRQAMQDLEPPMAIYRAFARAVRNSQADAISMNVAGVRARLAAIDDDATDIAMVGEMLGDTLNGLGQMRELVENLRDFTRLDRAKVALCDINKSLKNVVYIARSVVPNRVRIVEEYSELPEITCNPSQLNQVFLNLINNAAQAIPEQGDITVKSTVEDGFIRVDVGDTGQGIPPESLPHIFDNYYTTKPAGEGTGLGLHIAKTIVAEHGGDIKVATEPGKGSIFSVLLPLAAAPAAA
jgi:two-component system NtrC family sensor kinase